MREVKEEPIIMLSEQGRPLFVVLGLGQERSLYRVVPARAEDWKELLTISNHE